MNKNFTKALPVLFGFFVMGFCDVVGISTSYVKQDFNLSETLAGFIPSMVFIWFLLLSIPAAMAMNKAGRKNMVQVSNVITFIGMLLPFISYNFVTCMFAFVLLGIGNTILQVSLNPLLTNVVKGDALTSSLTAGQVVKAVSSFLPHSPQEHSGTGNIFSRYSPLSPCSQVSGCLPLLSGKKPRRVRRPLQEPCSDSSRTAVSCCCSSVFSS